MDLGNGKSKNTLGHYSTFKVLWFLFIRLCPFTTLHQFFCALYCAKCKGMCRSQASLEKLKKKNRKLNNVTSVVLYYRTLW